MQREEQWCLLAIPAGYTGSTGKLAIDCGGESMIVVSPKLAKSIMERKIWCHLALLGTENVTTRSLGLHKPRLLP